MDGDDCLFGNAGRLDAYISVIKAGPRLGSEFSRFAVETVNATKPVRKSRSPGSPALECSKSQQPGFFDSTRQKQRGVICRNRNAGADDRD